MTDSGWPALRSRLAAGRLVRAVNFHNTPASRRDELRRELEGYRERFAPVDETDLERLFATGRWHKTRPGLMLCFYNGYRNNYEVAYPLLEELGLVGWFFVPTLFVSTLPEEQAAYAAAHTLRVVPQTPGRLAMSWDEVRELDRRHVVASHTRSHARLAADAGTDALRDEVVGSQEDLERELGHRVRSFAWLYGGAHSPGSVAAALLAEAGYGFLFANEGIHRLPASQSDSRVGPSASVPSPLEGEG